MQIYSKNLHESEKSCNFVGKYLHLHAIMKRIFTFFFSLLSACTFSAYAAIVDGTCGDNLTWALNTEDNSLTISGTLEKLSLTAPMV